MWHLLTKFIIQSVSFKNESHICFAIKNMVSQLNGFPLEVIWR